MEESIFHAVFHACFLYHSQSAHALFFVSSPDAGEAPEILLLHQNDSHHYIGYPKLQWSVNIYFKSKSFGIKRQKIIKVSKLYNILLPLELITSNLYTNFFLALKFFHSLPGCIVLFELGALDPIPEYHAFGPMHFEDWFFATNFYLTLF